MKRVRNFVPIFHVFHVTLCWASFWNKKNHLKTFNRTHNRLITFFYWIIHNNKCTRYWTNVRVKELKRLKCCFHFNLYLTEKNNIWSATYLIFFFSFNNFKCLFIFLNRVLTPEHRVQFHIGEERRMEK